MMNNNLGETILNQSNNHAFGSVISRSFGHQRPKGVLRWEDSSLKLRTQFIKGRTGLELGIVFCQWTEIVQPLPVLEGEPYEINLRMDSF